MNENYKKILIPFHGNHLGSSCSLEISYLEDENSLLHHHTFPSLILTILWESGSKRIAQYYFTHGVNFILSSPGVIQKSDNSLSSFYKENSDLIKGKSKISSRLLLELAKDYMDSEKYRIFLDSIENTLTERKNGPAIILYSELDNKKTEIYFKNGNEHRDDGPAVIYSEDDKIISKEWWLDGRIIEI